MTLENFTTLAQYIDDEISLSDSEKIQKMVQLADLCRFIHSYNSDEGSLGLLIFDENSIQGKVNHTYYDNVRIGIVFYDITDLFSGHFSIQLHKDHVDLKELWHVLVTEPQSHNFELLALHFKEKPEERIHDRYFLMDFPNSTILRLDR